MKHYWENVQRCKFSLKNFIFRAGLGKIRLNYYISRGYLGVSRRSSHKLEKNFKDFIKKFNCKIQKPFTNFTDSFAKMFKNTRILKISIAVGGSGGPFQGRPQGGEGGSFPPKPKKIVVEKWCYFPELYKMTKVREDGIENG